MSDSGTSDKSSKVLGIIGFGRLGQYIVDQINTNGDKLGLSLGFVWNRTKTSLLSSKVDESKILSELSDFDKIGVDLIVEVCHPNVIRDYGTRFVRHSDLMIGSPSVLADTELHKQLMNASTQHSIFIPSGALWGGHDIRRMAETNTLTGLTVIMHFHPESLKLDGQLKTLNESIEDKPIILYEGPVRQLCALAPNNTNTMAATAIAGFTLGFDGTVGRLISDPNLRDHHRIEVEVIGPHNNQTNRSFRVNTTRISPTAGKDAVSSTATLASFLTSILNCEPNKGKGFHLC